MCGWDYDASQTDTGCFIREKEYTSMVKACC